MVGSKGRERSGVADVMSFRFWGRSLLSLVGAHRAPAISFWEIGKRSLLSKMSIYSADKLNV
ncbi:MAG: hypothetical protein SXA11_08100 [Cyanobacteriota bacterium]|nr:hypothetical protein [Cyanobacteriota bacterium]